MPLLMLPRTAGEEQDQKCISMRDRRVVVIGAGVGGLVSALMLAQQGLDVTVIEAAAGPGGKMREVAVAGRPMDAGPTVFTMRHVFEAIFDAVGETFADHVGLQPVTMLARHGWGADSGAERAQLDLFASRAESADAIARFSSPQEGRNYLAFCEEARAIHDTLLASFMQAERPSPFGLVRQAGFMPMWRTRPWATMGSALRSRFNDPRLRQLFGRYATYCGSSPFLAPATLMLIAHVEQEGVWLIEGGMHRLAKALAALIEAKGGRIRYGAPVSDILIDGSQACGVRLADGEVIPADAVILNGDRNALATGLLGDAAKHGTNPTPQQMRSLSAVTWNMVAETKGFPLVRHNVFFSRNYPAEFDAIFKRGTIPAEPTVYVCAQDRDDEGRLVSLASPDGTERLLVLVNAPATGDTHPFRFEETDRCQQSMFSVLERSGLRIGRQVAPAIVTTPVDFARLFPGTGHPRDDGLVLPAGLPVAAQGPLSGGGQRASGGGRADGGAVRAAGGAKPDGGFGFDVPVAPGGYAWWYVDALSDDGAYALAVIGFIGSVFSPYYALARRRAARTGTIVDPANHCAINVALYGPDKTRWAMTERGRAHVHAEPHSLSVGPSAMVWDGEAMVISLDEISTPFLRRIRGTVRVFPTVLMTETHVLNAEGNHGWRPISPVSRVEVCLSEPALRWSGSAYLDHNHGDAPITEGFRSWTWSRAPLRHGAAVFYDGVRKTGESFHLGLHFDGGDRAKTIVAPPLASLPSSKWRISRMARSEASAPARIVETLEDTPFYARSIIAARVEGEDVQAVHESLSVDRLTSTAVQLMLPFRMPRRGCLAASVRFLSCLSDQSCWKPKPRQSTAVMVISMMMRVLPLMRAS
eukprot:gene17452-23004_t